MRRRVIISCLSFVALAVAYLLVLAPNDALRQQLAVSLVSLAGTVIVGYLGFATYDDKVTKQAQAKADDSQEKQDDKEGTPQ